MMTAPFGQACGQGVAGAMEDALFATVLNDVMSEQVDALPLAEDALPPPSELQTDSVIDQAAPDLMSQNWLPMQTVDQPKMADLSRATWSGQDKTAAAEPILPDAATRDKPPPHQPPAQDDIHAAIPQTPMLVPISKDPNIAAPAQGHIAEDKPADQLPVTPDAADSFQAGEQRSDTHMAIVAAQAARTHKPSAAPDKVEGSAQAYMSAPVKPVAPASEAAAEAVPAKAESGSQSGVKPGAVTLDGAHSEAAQRLSKEMTEPVADQDTPQSQTSPDNAKASQNQTTQSLAHFNATTAPAQNAASMPAAFAAQPTMLAHIAGQPLAQSTLIHLAPHMAQPDSTAMAVQIFAKASEGESSFDIRLDPPELGRVDVKLLIDEAGRAHSHLTVEKVQTLDLMLRDREGLERALKDAGLDVAQDGLNFSLKSQDQQDHAAEGFRNRAHIARMESDTAAPDMAAAQHYRAEAGRLDIRV